MYSNKDNFDNIFVVLQVWSKDGTKSGNSQSTSCIATDRSYLRICANITQERCRRFPTHFISIFYFWCLHAINTGLWRLWCRGASWFQFVSTLFIGISSVIFYGQFCQNVKDKYDRAINFPIFFVFRDTFR